MTDGIPFSILVVDDDEDDRIMIDEAFFEIGAGSEVKKFIDGKSLLHYLKSIDVSQYPSLIVLDNTLPELEAMDILSLLKRTPDYQSIPVVIYTTIISPAKKKQLLSMGAYACFEKGNSMQEIVSVVKELMRLSQNDLQHP